jgi:hypothetical protein
MLRHRLRWLLLFPVSLALILCLQVLQAAPAPVTLIFEAENVAHLSGKCFMVMKFTRDPAGKVSGDHVLATPAIAKGSARRGCIGIRRRC